MIATSTVSGDQSTSPTRVPTSTESSGSVNSSMFAWPCWKVKIRTRSPIETASSTSAVISRGVETATSTPQASPNIHSFLGLFTRATVRGTPYSVLASSDRTRLALSSPVAATTTSASSRPASDNESTSQASASSQSASGTEECFMASGALSTSSTWCPLPSSSRAIDRPTLPAPAMTTRTSAPASVLVRRTRQPALELRDGVDGREQVDDVALLVDGLGRRDDALAEPGDERDPGAGLGLQVRAAAGPPTRSPPGTRPSARCRWGR